MMKSVRDDEMAMKFVTPMLWVALIAALSVGGSYVYACAAPFAAVGALAARKMDRATGLTLVLLAWSANQIVGYGLLDYPQTANSFAWGGAIGLGAVAALFAARVVGNFGWSNVVATVASFASAFIAYEGTLYLASFGLGGSDAFSFDIVSRILVINAVAFTAILALYAVVGLLKTGREKAIAVRA
ncbi:conserved hypothetical protein [Hyphomicrobium denitrificans ATCC 51888]|uniref:Uncharacterized protein n=2 Tax=Hyphomicrobium denitrificans TaxID=53399 RepID=D8JTK5_HYPDA|nr:conserved hypothetical protein [Hyphomicrobium denitrificans ATCC 51888]